jgi:hypothetical protein
MRILIDIGHPAHIHYFRNLADYFIAKGGKVLFTTRDKEVTIALLENYGYDYVNMGKPFKSAPGKIWSIFWFTFRLFLISLRFRPSILLNATHYSAFTAWLLRKPHIAIEDSFNMEQVRLYLPFTSAILTATYDHPNLGRKNFRYDGYQELAYLHPKRYTADDSIYSFLGLEKGELYAIVRFVSWNASHDRGEAGFLDEHKLLIVNELQKYLKVFISSEALLPDNLLPYKINIPPEHMHDALNFATIFVGEGATMASECAVLGTPAIYVNSIIRPYTTEQEEKYELLYNFRNSNGVLEKVKELMEQKDINAKWKKKHSKLLKDKIDVSAFFIWFVENYPECKKIMKENPDYQYNFK